MTARGVPTITSRSKSAWYIPGPTALVDVYTPSPNTTGTLVVDDPNHVIAACDTPGDNDWFAVTLTAGITYEFGQYAYAGGIPGTEGNGVPLADAYLELYDDDGNLISLADGGGPNTPSGLDALMTFQATYSGTYYVNATSYDNDGDGVGDFAGDYEIFAKTATGTVYTTEYDISSPLHSIDWGGVRVNRAHQSVENPDGMEGPRVTGDPAADPADVEGNALGFPGKNVIYLYFAGEGDTYFNQDSTIPAQVVVQNPYQYEVQAMLTAANEFSKVADVVFVSNYTFNATTGLYERDDGIEYKPGSLGPESGVQYAAGVDGDGFDADFFYFSYPGTPGPVISLLGSMNPPDTGDEGVAQFNSADERWNAQMLQPGGFSFVTLIHEFGHGMGLAHPHDTGGGSSVMPGVVTSGVPGDDGGAGAFDLNQGVNTMMSYNDGWEKSPYGNAETNNEGYGWLGSLMALDIAVIQDKYGVNEDWATGNDTYRPEGRERVGRLYRCRDRAAGRARSTNAGDDPRWLLSGPEHLLFVDLGCRRDRSDRLWRPGTPISICAPRRCNMRMAAAAGCPTPPASSAASPSPTASPSRTRSAAAATTCWSAMRRQPPRRRRGRRCPGRARRQRHLFRRQCRRPHGRECWRRH